MHFHTHTFNKNIVAMGWKEKTTLDGLKYYYNESTKEIGWEKPDELKSKKELEDMKGDWTWVPHPVHVWQPARRVGTNGNGTQCVTVEGKNVTVPTDGLMNGPETGGRNQEVPMWDLSHSALVQLEDDLVMLDGINEGMISHTLRERYGKDELYTWVGASRNVLVSVNPYKRLPLYTKEKIDMYHNKPPNLVLAPHPFSIAGDSYDSMSFNNIEQSILISGESGSGKTEATKQCLKYLADVAGSENNVEGKILACNPLLESYGNAKTIRNNNSSRFGKWIEVHFHNVDRSICGARILNYLLEKSRVVFQQQNERNFHIFYQMCQDSSTSSKYELTGGADSFRYLSQSGLIKAKDVDDKSDFQATLSAMQELNFSAEEQDWALRIAAAVLHLGNVKFVEKAEKGSVKGSSISNSKSVEIAADFLGVPAKELTRVLCYRSISVRRETSVIPLNPTDARDGCDSLAKGIYGRLFDYLVLRINDSLKGDTGKFIGILDIFGFEIFENNSFEQLCINFANEKLQQQFNRTTFKEEEALYQAEGIKFQHIEFIDNQIVLDLIEKKPMGILLMLDEESLVPEGTNTKFMNKIESNNVKNPKFLTDKHRKLENSLAFEIDHYAGIVKYDSRQFMEKNKDTLFADMYSVCADSKDGLTAGLFPDASARRQLKSLSFQFRGQLNDLMNSLYETESRYIRCVKPNNKQSADQFEASLVLEQLRYSGVFEAVSIRKQGYPFRMTYRQFACRYKCINTDYKYKASRKDDKAICKELMEKSAQDFSEVQFGKTRVLYRAKEHRNLKLLRNLALETIVPVCQKLIRGGIAREFGRRLKKATSALANALKVANDIKLMDDAIAAVSPTIGPLSKVFKAQPVNLKKAKAARDDLQKWVDLEKIFDRLTKVDSPTEKQFGELTAAVARASELLEIPRTKTQVKLFEVARQQVIYMEIKVNESHLDSKGSQYKSLSSFKGLRDREAFAKKGFFLGRKKLEEGMHTYSKGKLPTSLTQIDDKLVERQATQMFALVQKFMGDKKHPMPDQAGAQAVQMAITTPLLQDELFVQIMKQCSGNPESPQKGYDLMAVCVHSFIPSKELQNFVLMFFRETGHNQQFLSAYHNTKYGEKAKSAPSGDNMNGMITKFKASNDRSRFSVMPKK